MAERASFVLPKVGLLSLLAALCLPAPGTADEAYRFKRMWPTLLQPWYFSLPSDVAIDESGNIYVADMDNHRIIKFTSDGYFLTRWGSLGNAVGQFNEPISNFHR